MQFRTTHWSVVLAAGARTSQQSQEALAKLCQTCWFPLYAFIRKRGHSPEQAEDLTQEFFARLLEKNTLAHADRDRGRFRSFLMTSVENFLRDEHGRVTAQKRGGAAARATSPASPFTPAASNLSQDTAKARCAFGTVAPENSSAPFPPTIGTSAPWRFHPTAPASPRPPSTIR